MEFSMRLLAKLAAIAASVSLVAACGGGDGGGATNSNIGNANPQQSNSVTTLSAVILTVN
jgi:hypothetical protein